MENNTGIISEIISELIDKACTLAYADDPREQIKGAVIVTTDKNGNHCPSSIVGDNKGNEIDIENTNISTEDVSIERNTTGANNDKDTVNDLHSDMVEQSIGPVELLKSTIVKQPTDVDEGGTSKYISGDDQIGSNEANPSTEVIVDRKFIEEKILEISGDEQPESISIGGSQLSEVDEEQKGTDEESIDQTTGTDVIETISNDVDLLTVIVEEPKDVDKGANEEFGGDHQIEYNEVNQTAEIEEEQKGVEVIGDDHIESNSNEINQSAEVVEKPKGIDDATIDETGGNYQNDPNADQLNQSSEFGNVAKGIDEVSADEIRSDGPIDTISEEIKSTEVVKLLQRNDLETIVEVHDNGQFELSSVNDQSIATVDALNNFEEKPINEASENTEIESRSIVVTKLNCDVEGRKGDVGVIIEEYIGVDDYDYNSLEIEDNCEDTGHSTEIVVEVKGVDQGSIERINDLKIDGAEDKFEEISTSAGCGEKKPIAKNVSTPGSEPTSTSPQNYGLECFSDEELSRKGYYRKTITNTIQITNLAVNTAVFTDCEVRCAEMPRAVTENELIPLFETAGKLYQLRINDNINLVYVTYTTPEDAENAVKILDRRLIGGRRISVERYFPNVRLFIRPIPFRTTRQAVFNEIKRLTVGLLKVYLFDAIEEVGKNRGYCYIEYEDHISAMRAKRDLSNQKLFGMPIICDWPERKVCINSLTLYIQNLRPNIHASELRKLFAAYGEVSEIDKNGNFASILFRNAEDAKRAARGVDKSKLGNANVDITFTHFKSKPPIYQNWPLKTYNQTASSDVSKNSPNSSQSKNNTDAGTRQNGFRPCENKNVTTPFIYKSALTCSTRRQISTIDHKDDKSFGPRKDFRRDQH